MTMSGSAAWVIARLWQLPETDGEAEERLREAGLSNVGARGELIRGLRERRWRTVQSVIGSGGRSLFKAVLSVGNLDGLGRAAPDLRKRTELVDGQAALGGGGIVSAGVTAF
jgi:hypothetical protein